MKKIKYLLNVTLIGTVSLLPAIMASCASYEAIIKNDSKKDKKNDSSDKDKNSKNVESKIIKASLSISHWKFKSGPSAVKDYQKLFNETMAKIKKGDPKYKDEKPLKLKINDGSNKVNTLQDVATNKENFAIVDSSLLTRNNTLVKPYLQTITRKFFNDNEGATKDQVKGFSNQINEYFKKHPYNTWTDQAQKWDGAKYEAMYASEDDLINSYRGMILIAGDKTQLDRIRKAWTDKNWEVFRSYGILTGKVTSQGKYKLQNKLFKNHFGSKADFTDSGNINSGKITIGQGSNAMAKIGDAENAAIAFDDANSFAWTKRDVADNEFSYSSKTAGKRVEVLTYTDPALCDVSIFSPNVTELQRKLIAKTFIILSLDKKDEFGKKNGYNGYRKIDDLEEFYNSNN